MLAPKFAVFGLKFCSFFIDPFSIYEFCNKKYVLKKNTNKIYGALQDGMKAPRQRAITIN